MSQDPPSRQPLDAGDTAVVLDKARRILEERKLDITKSWLNLLIGRIDDVEALEQFPTHQSIRTSIQLIEGLAEALRNEAMLEQFAPGGSYYELASTLGLLRQDHNDTITSLSGSLGALEDAVWEHLSAGLRRQDREVLQLVKVLREGLRLIMTAAADAHHRQSSAELNRLAHTDSLTALHNRRFLEHELERHVELYKRYRHPFAVLMLDFDNLKFLNDTFGHAAGDSALQHLSALMHVNVRDVDIPCRFGGDEFVVLMPEADKASAQAAGRRISESVVKTPIKIGRSFATLHVSFGVAACPEDGVEAEALLQEADACLYRAKAARIERVNE